MLCQALLSEPPTHYSFLGAPFAFGDAISSWCPRLMYDCPRICFSDPKFLGYSPHPVDPRAITRRMLPKASYNKSFWDGARIRGDGTPLRLEPTQTNSLSNVSARLCYVNARSHFPRLQKQWARAASPIFTCTRMLSHSIGPGPICLLHPRINSKVKRVVQHKLPAPLASLPLSSFCSAGSSVGIPCLVPSYTTPAFRACVYSDPVSLLVLGGISSRAGIRHSACAGPQRYVFFNPGIDECGTS